MIVTPPTSTTSPGCVSSQLPPVSAARSTITEPGRIFSTAEAGISLGAGRPGIAAVVITTSNSGIRSSSASCCALLLLGRQLAGVAALGLLADDAEVEEGRAERLHLLAHGRAARRSPETTAPSRRAVAIACSPATPAPSTSARAGAIVPAAVVSIGKNRGRCSAASSTAL